MSFVERLSLSRRAPYRRFHCDYSDIEYRYYVRRMPFMDYTSKQVEPLLTKEEVLREGGVNHAQWRLQRKRYSIRVEFQQAGSLGECAKCHWQQIDRQWNLQVKILQ